MSFSLGLERWFTMKGSINVAYSYCLNVEINKAKLNMEVLPALASKLLKDIFLTIKSVCDTFSVDNLNGVKQYLLQKVKDETLF